MYENRKSSEESCSSSSTSAASKNPPQFPVSNSLKISPPPPSHAPKDSKWAPSPLHNPGAKKSGGLQLFGGGGTGEGGKFSGGSGESGDNWVDLEELYRWLQELEDTKVSQSFKNGKMEVLQIRESGDEEEEEVTNAQREVFQNGQENRSRVLTPHSSKISNGSSVTRRIDDDGLLCSPAGRTRRKNQERRNIRHENRFQSAREEAVEQALAAERGPKSSFPMSSKRPSVPSGTKMSHHALSRPSGGRCSRSSSDDEDDDESIGSSETSGNFKNYTTSENQHHFAHPYAIENYPSQGNNPKSDSASSGELGSLNKMNRERPPKLPQRNRTSSNGLNYANMVQPDSKLRTSWKGMEQIQNNSIDEEKERLALKSRTKEIQTELLHQKIQNQLIRNSTDSGMEISKLVETMNNLRTNSAQSNHPPDVTSVSQLQRSTPADRLILSRLNLKNTQEYLDAESLQGSLSVKGRWKVSAKIQQLLNTLKRPKRRPLREFYEDDDIELEMAAKNKDPNAPKPEGNTMTPAKGEQLLIPSGLPRNLEAAVQRYGLASYKAPVATLVDPNGKPSTTLTYGKLLSRSYKVAYALTSRSGSGSSKGESLLKTGDRVALVYPNTDPINFLIAFYGCLFAGLVPLPIEVPVTKRDAGSQEMGFLLGSCSISVALTSDSTYKNLPRGPNGELVELKGWPKLTWFITEHLGKTPKDYIPSPRVTDDAPAYIEYTRDGEGAVMGVGVTRAALLSHSRSLTSACNYTEGEVSVCVVDFRRGVGLWHSVLTSVLNGIHTLFIPHALMRLSPAAWILTLTKYRASVGVVKSRDLHWGLLSGGSRSHEFNFSSLRLLLLSDGSNPWSLSSSDQFLATFSGRGLRPDVICPTSASPQALTLSLRRPGCVGVNATGRGVLSMQGLSYGVVRVDQETSLTSLTLQDCGQVMPGATLAVVRVEGAPYLCRTDEVGEICVESSSTGSSYWGLPGLTNSTFKLSPLLEDGSPASTAHYVRSGLLGFLGPGGLVFVVGSRGGLLRVSGRSHNADDLMATILAVEPMKFIYRGRLAVFSISVLRDERICVVAEQRPDSSEEESFQWMSRVLQAVDSIHQVGIYALLLVPCNTLPKTPLGSVLVSETKLKFLSGSLHPSNVLMCPHGTVTNLPQGREVQGNIGPASVMVGNIVQGNRLAAAQGRELGVVDEESDTGKKYQFISEILRWRSVSTADHVIFSLLSGRGSGTTTLTCSQLHKRAERVGAHMLERGKISTGDHVALIFPPGLDLIIAFYGSLYAGAVPVTVRPPHPQNLSTTLPTVRMICEVSKSVLILSSLNTTKLLKSKEASSVVDFKNWPPVLDIDDLPKRKLSTFYRAPTPEMTAYLDFSVSTTGMLGGIKISHAAITSLCRSLKLSCELYPSRHVALSLDPYSGLGFSLWCLSSIYSGHHSLLIPPCEVESSPSLWLSALSTFKVRDTFCSYGVLELSASALSTSPILSTNTKQGLSLAPVRNCVVVGEERPRVKLLSNTSKLLAPLGLSPRALSTSFGTRVNVAICLQGAASPEPSGVYVDLRALRHDRVSLVERGSPHSLYLLESGKLLPGLKVIIANPETKGQCGDSHLGEIWVQSPHNSSGYFTMSGDESSYSDHFNAKLVTGNTSESYARTGYLGFLRRTENIQADGELHDAVFVVGSLDETIMLRGMRYHPIDIENTILRAHKKIIECAIFTWTNLLVVVAELDGAESEALDVVPLITSHVLEEHFLIVGVVVVVDPGVVPINSRGEKQRMHLRDGFLADQLDPIFVAYNM